jgi:hypothetical protein
MTAVRGGDGNQANGVAQTNLQQMLAAVNVGNGLKVGDNSPVIIQSDNTFKQDADNDSSLPSPSTSTSLKENCHEVHPHPP